MGFKPERSGNSLPEACGAAQPQTPAFWCFWKPPASSPLPAHLQDPAPTTAPRRAALRLMLSAGHGHSSLPSSPGISADSSCSAQGTRPESGSSSSSFPPSHSPCFSHLSAAVPQALPGGGEAGLRVDPRLHLPHGGGRRQLKRPAAQAAMEDGDPGQPAATRETPAEESRPQPTFPPSKPPSRRPPEAPRRSPPG